MPYIRLYQMGFFIKNHVLFAIVFSFLFSHSAFAVGVKVSGTRGVSYKGECRTSSGKKLKIEGRIPKVHNFKSSEPIQICRISKVKKSKRKGVLKLAIDQSRKVGLVQYVDNNASDIVLKLLKGQMSGAVQFEIVEVDNRLLPEVEAPTQKATTRNLSDTEA